MRFISYNRKTLHVVDKSRLWKILHCKINKKVELLQFWICIFLLEWQLILNSLMYVTFFSLTKHERGSMVSSPSLKKRLESFFRDNVGGGGGLSAFSYGQWGDSFIWGKSQLGISLGGLQYQFLGQLANVGPILWTLI